MEFQDWSQAIPFRRAAEMFRRDERAIHVSTLHRWRMRGIRGRKLQAHRIGGIWYVFPHDLEAFIEGTTSDAQRRDDQATSERLDPGSAAAKADEALRRLNW